MGRLSGKAAIITGGTSGIGLETARHFIAEGAKVLIAGRRETINAVQEDLGDQAIAVAADIGDMSDLDRLIAVAAERLGKVDIFFGNAGVNAPGAFESMSEDAFDKLFRTNVKGAFFSVQKAIPILTDGAAIILTGSVAGSRAFDGDAAAYAATKAALRALARNWTLELRHRRIRVNVVSPGPVKTPMVDSYGFDAAQREELDVAIANMIPAGRWGKPDDIARLVLFLASDEATFINGSEIFADGGLSLI